MKDSIFIQTVWNYYKENKRVMSWRDVTSPYFVFISEVMLQQTQVARVLIKFPLFIQLFPDFKTLALAKNIQVLSAWQGMGYNRRALYLKAAAEVVQSRFNGILPEEVDILGDLPGIGNATASSIVAFAYNKPVVFIETNIRRVYIHHYFPHEQNISDDLIIPLVEKTLDRKNPREWYWALMDYGAFLSKQGENPNRKSKHYTKQKKFKGSVREIRGGILKLLLKKPSTLAELKKISSDERLPQALLQLKKEGFIAGKGKKYSVK